MANEPRFRDDRDYPHFYAAKAHALQEMSGKTIQTPAYIGFRWHDEQGRRCTRIIADFDNDETPKALAAHLNDALVLEKTRWQAAASPVPRTEAENGD